jgi:hypothetical protein
MYSARPGPMSGSFVPVRVRPKDRALKGRAWEAAVKVLRYVVGTMDLGLQFGSKTRDVVGYCDADYAGDLDSRKSTTAYVWLMHGGAVSWRSVLQPTVALSTAEAEYMAAAATAREVLWMRKVLRDLGVKGVPSIRSDSQSAMALVRNPIVSQRSKHIDVLHHLFESGQIVGKLFLRTATLRGWWLTASLRLLDSIRLFGAGSVWDWSVCETGLSGS